MDWTVADRPRRLSDLYGLENIKKYFYEKAKRKDWPKAVLLKGQFGNGKTSTAKIIATMMACKQPKENGDACLECDACLAILEERWDRDVKIINGGQSGKADVISEVEDFIATPAFYGSPRRVIIIEEIQELSTAAKNSLLKTLEHVRQGYHFILLSMDLGAASGFSSRCVPFLFKKLSIKDLMLFMKQTLENKGLWTDTTIPIEFKTQGLATIAQTSVGSLRQALQILDQCVTGKFYTSKEIQENTGYLDENDIVNVLLKFLSGDSSVWAELQGFEPMDFFALGLKIVSDAELYRVAQYTISDNEYFIANTQKLLSYKHAFIILKDCFLTIAENAKPFLRKPELMLYLSKAFESIIANKTSTRMLNSTPAAIPTRCIQGL